MEKKNLKANDFNMNDEIKKVQNEYAQDIKSEKGIVDIEELEKETDDIDLDILADKKNNQELERLRTLKKIKSGDRINYFMVDNDDILREVSFKFPSTRVIMGLSEYGVSGDGRLFLDLTRSIEVLQANKLFITKFDVDNFCQEELEGFGGFLLNMLRNPRKFIKNLY